MQTPSNVGKRFANDGSGGTASNFSCIHEFWLSSYLPIIICGCNWIQNDHIDVYVSCSVHLLGHSCFYTCLHDSTSACTRTRDIGCPEHSDIALSRDARPPEQHSSLRGHPGSSDTDGTNAWTSLHPPPAQQQRGCECKMLYSQIACVIHHFAAPVCRNIPLGDTCQF